MTLTWLKVDGRINRYRIKVQKERLNGCNKKMTTGRNRSKPREAMKQEVRGKGKEGGKS